MEYRKLRKLRIGDAEVGKEYISALGKILQFLGNSAGMSQVTVVALNKSKKIPSDYIVYEQVYDDKSLDNEPPKEENGADTTTNEENVMVEQHSEENKSTIKALIVEMLQSGEKTKDELAQAVIDASLTKNTSIKKVKSYVGIVLNNVKKRKDLKFVTVSPGKYRIDP